MDFLAYALIAVLGYLLGSIPTGFLVAKAKGIDIRTVGSGNIGATNAFRVLGAAAGSFVLIADALKGFLAVLLHVPLMGESTDYLDACQILSGICAILGHNYTCWLKFKGGKGIATSAGVFFALAPAAFGIALGTWLVVFVASRYVSLASITAAVALPVAVAILSDSLTLKIITAIIGALAIYKHKPNIRRLLAGTENRISFKKKEPTT